MTTQLDFLRGRREDDILRGEIKDEFNERARYGMINVLNEIVLSKTVKDIVKSKEVQDIAKRYGFVDMQFPEPIVAVIHKEYKDKYLVYKYKENVRNKTHGGSSMFHSIATYLREIFFKNGILPADLRDIQFLVSKETDGLHLILIDIEGYVPKETL